MLRNSFCSFLRNGDHSQYSFLRREYAAGMSQMDSSSSSSEPSEATNSSLFPLIRLFADPSSILEGMRFKRLFLVVLAINVVSSKLEGYRRGIMSRDFSNDRVKTLEIYFKTTNEPQLNVTEVRKVLTGCIFDESRRHLVDQWCKDFEDIIPFCTKKYEPRRLSHLCRCQVRQNYYGSESTLPAVIGKLNLPKVIKDFLLCKPLEKRLYTL